MTYENGQAPFDSIPPLVHLQWHAEDGIVSNEGQGEPAPALGGQGDSAPVSTESYFYEHPETGHRFKTKDELDKEWKQSYMRRNDYSKKTGELGNQRRQFESERAAFERQRKEFEEEMRRTKEEYKAFDEKIRKNPQIYQQLKQQLKSQTGFDTATVERLIEEKYGDKFKKMEQWEAEQRTKQQQEEAAAALKLMYEDFDFDAINKTFQKLVTEGTMQDFMELMYYAEKGRSFDPLDEQRKLTEKLQKKKEASLVPSGGSKATSEKPKYKTMDEAMAAALEANKRR